MLAKLTALHIHLTGFVVILIVAAILFFIVIRPKQDTLETTRTETTNYRTTQHGDDYLKHQQDLKNTLLKGKQTDQGWASVSVLYMPSLPFRNDVIKSYESFQFLPGYWGKKLTAWYNNQRNTGVSLVPGTAFPIPAFPNDPNYISSIKYIDLPGDNRPWDVMLECKNFDALLAHLRRFNNASLDGKRLLMGMPVVSNVTLEGNSPHLLARYQLALYMIASQEPPKANTKLGAESGTGGLGGIGGGPGMMGGQGAGKRGMMGGPGGPSLGMGMGGPGAGKKGGMTGAPATLGK